MINPQSILLRNFCQHERFEMSFTSGTAAITAPNGAGKSTVLAGIVYALTGWCDPSWGTQQKFQKDGEPVPGFAEMVFTVGEDTYTVKRYVKTTSKCTDTLYQGTKLIAGKRQDVDREIASLAGMDVSLLAHLIWLRQGSLDWLLTAAPKQINTVLAGLFDCSRLEKIRDKLKLAIDSVAVLRNDFEERKQTAAQIIASLPSEEYLKTQIEALTKQTEELHAELSKYDSCSGLTAKEKSDYMDTYRKELNEIQYELCPDPPETVVSIEDINKVSAELGNVQKKLSETTAVRSDIKASITDVVNKLKRLEAVEDTHICKYCGSAIGNADEYMRNLVLEATDGDYSDKDEALSVYKSQLKKLTDEYNKADKELVRLSASAKDLDEAVKILQEEHKQWIEYQVVQQHNKEKKQYEKELVAKIAEVEAYVVKPDDLVDKIKLHRDLTQKLEELKETLYTTISQRGAAENDLERAEQDKVLYTRNSSIRSILTEIRACFSQTRAQARYLTVNIRKLNNQIAEFLSMTTMPYTLWLDEEEHLFKYKMMEPDAEEHAAAMLSGAQKAVAALIVQLSLIRICDIQCKLLLLDEVDGALSPENKQSIVSLQESLVADPEYKLIFVSQSQTVLDCCGTIISL